VETVEETEVVTVVETVIEDDVTEITEVT